jgi:hypothetical protein
LAGERRGGAVNSVTQENSDRLLVALNRNAGELWELSKDGGIAVFMFENDADLREFASSIGWDGQSEVFRLDDDHKNLCAEAFKVAGSDAGRTWFGEQCAGRVLMLVSGSIQPVTIDGKGGMIPLEPWRFMQGVAN